MEISAVLITFNEEKRLEPALKSVQGLVSEIIVVDSHSTDDTVRIARRYTEHVYERKWTNFADQKNFANAKASCPWVLSLDADERISPELRSEILSLADREPVCAWCVGCSERRAGMFPMGETCIGKMPARPESGTMR